MYGFLLVYYICFFRQGHWKCHHLIERKWLPIDVLY